MDSSSELSARAQSAEPLNNMIKGDILAGFLVFVIALPLCLGIAMASGFPPVAGVLTAIVGGILGTFVGSARLTIKGPAAGMIVIALGAVTELGGEDLALGYRRALAVGVVAASVQIIFAWRRFGGLGAAMPPSVVHGMLAAIGVIIVAKQAHFAMGVVPEGHEPLELLAEIPHSFANNNPEILAIGVVALVILALWPRLVGKVWSKRVPAALVVLAVAIPLGFVFDLDHEHDYALFGHMHHLGPNYLLNLPGSIVSAVAFPDFSAIFTLLSLKYVVMFALVGSIESTLSVVAVDAMDSEKRPSDLNKDLMAVGVGNLVASSIGGLPMISEIVRSRANIDAGAKSRWSNFAHGVFLLLFVALAPGFLHHIPLAALAAMLVFIGLRLASPKELVHARQIGVDQLILFTTTLVITLAVDLLVGIAAGIALKVVLHRIRGASFRDLFQAKVVVDTEGTTMHVHINDAASFLVLVKLRRALTVVAPHITDVEIDLQAAKVVDHTFLAQLDAISMEWPHATLHLKGLDSLEAVSKHPLATRLHRTNGTFSAAKSTQVRS